MIQFVLAAPASGSGKTTLTCALLAALKKRGFWPCAFKSGPDYIDPMFHRSALRVDSHNLDLFFSAPDTVRALYAHYAAGHGAALCEGAMGFYDGLNCTTAASAWALADTLGLPVLLVVQPKGASVTLAAQINGLKNFRTPSHLAGILLNDCSPRLHQLLAPLLERETGLPVLGYLPHLPDAVVESRHLGLKTAEEVSGLQEKIERLAEAVSALTSLPAPVSPLPDFLTPASPTVRIAVAKDEAFCFTYAETLDALRAAGAELVFFSPLHDAALPEGIGGVYLPGGYPELHAKALRENMAGVLPGQGFRVGKLVRFGYAALTAQADSMLFRRGEALPVHEFHHWDTTANGDAFTARKADGRSWPCGFANEHFYAGFPHLYWAGTSLPRRFVTAARSYLQKEPNP